MIIFWGVPFIDLYWLPEDELNLLSGDGYKSILPSHPIIYWGTFSIWLLVNIGLFFYVKIAKSVFLPLLVIFVVLSMFWGYQVLTPYESTVRSLIDILDGVILVMIYFTSISEKFDS